MNTNNQMPGLPEQNSVSSAMPENNHTPSSRPVFGSLELFVSIGVGVLLLITLLFLFSSKKRAENVSRALDPALVAGLKFNNQEFNTSVGTTYVQVGEGGERSVGQTRITGSTLPIVSRYNFQTMTDINFEVIGAAPWALTNNFAANLDDPELMRRVLANDKMIEAFLQRPDVDPLLNDPQLLAAFAGEAATMEDFFEEDTVKAILADEKMVRMIASSKWMSHLLTSSAVKYYRDRPQEAASIIRGNAYLARLQQNPYIQAAVKENPYLKSIASVLLKGASTGSTAGKTPAKPAPRTTSRSRRNKK